MDIKPIPLNEKFLLSIVIAYSCKNQMDALLEMFGFSVQELDHSASPDVTYVLMVYVHEADFLRYALTRLNIQA